jgi:predicted O-methyltransferase YrrM/SAM-dependent methyltransferase
MADGSLSQTAVATRRTILAEDLLEARMGEIVDGIALDGREEEYYASDAGSGAAAAPGGSVPPLLAAAQARRVALLEALPLGDLTDKVCVDHGVGSWGFGATFPSLQRCAYAVGVDVSRAALVASERISAAGEWPYGENYVYLTARGGHLRLRDESVDVFFAGDSLERVENIEYFLDEVHRVLRPGGRLVLTPANADAYLYRLRGERYGSGVHRSLLGWDELNRYLTPRFETVAAHGFNASVHEDMDAAITDPAFVTSWTEQLADRPDLATSIVLLARRRDGHRRACYRQQSYHHSHAAIAYGGAWETVPLHRSITARMGTDGDLSALVLDFEGTDLLVFFWAHTWSGFAFVEVDGVCAEPVNLYSALGGFRRLHLGGLRPGRHRLRIRGGWHRDPRSQSNQVIFYEAIGYARLDEEGGPMASTVPQAPVDHNFATRPSRFGVIYTTPAHMTAPERVLLYSLVLGLRPRRCLEIGTHKGGSALVIGAALDDLGTGTLVCVDPVPMVADEHWAQVRHLATMIAGPSPDVLPRAVEAAGGRFDFALIDGDHEFPGVVRDIEGVLGVLEPTAYLVFHDANYFEVARAIDEMVCKYADRLVDCGMLSVQQTPEDRVVNGRPVVWGGLRMVRYHRPG